MRPVVRGLLIAVFHVLLVAAVGGKLLYDRQALPRAWVRTAGVDPQLPIRGRYVSLRLIVEADGLEPVADPREKYQVYRVKLQVVDGALHAAPLAGTDDSLAVPEPMVQQLTTPAGPAWALIEPIAFYLAENAPDPTRLGPDQTLWAEVTVPANGAPRPLRLEVRDLRQSPAAAPPAAAVPGTP